jgi:hypothetical protein
LAFLVFLEQGKMIQRWPQNRPGRPFFAAENAIHIRRCAPIEIEIVGSASGESAAGSVEAPGMGGGQTMARRQVHNEGVIAVGDWRRPALPEATPPPLRDREP